VRRRASAPSSDRGDARKSSVPVRTR
jgi:hypothetical protein